MICDFLTFDVLKVCTMIHSQSMQQQYLEVKISSTTTLFFQTFLMLLRCEKMAVLVVKKRNVTRKIENLDSIMANLNFVQDVANKREIRLAYCGQICYPVASCKNEPLQFSY